jgi:hypothetical protein
VDVSRLEKVMHCDSIPIASKTSLPSVSWHSNNRSMLLIRNSSFFVSKILLMMETMSALKYG